MSRKQIVRAALNCAIAATVTGFVLPKASQAADLRPTGDAQPASDAVLIAQDLPSNVRSLSASGYGRVTAPVDQAAIVFSYSSNYYPEPVTDENVIASPPTVQESDLNSVVNALAGAGISRSAISVTRDAYGLQSLRLVVQVDRPTSERINTLVELANAAATEDNKFASNSTGVVYTARDCQAAETTARQMAVEEARRQATTMASAVGVQIGDILSVSGSTNWGYSGPSLGSCPSSISDVLSYIGLYGAQNYDPSVPLGVPVDASVSITYTLQ